MCFGRRAAQPGTPDRLLTLAAARVLPGWWPKLARALPLEEMLDCEGTRGKKNRKRNASLAQLLLVHS